MTPSTPGRSRRPMPGLCAAGMDTTVHSIGHMVWLLAEHPDQWNTLRASPALGVQGSAALRVAGPVVRTHSARRLARWRQHSARLAVLFGSANRDERKWQDADRFDIMRDNIDHLGPMPPA